MTTCTPKCPAGATCKGNGDCIGGLCVGQKCQPTCTDGVQNGDETDKDCGGTHCPSCAFGLACLMDSDCASAYCNVTNRCDAQTLATGPQYPEVIAVDANNVYWGAGMQGQVLQVGRNGGTVTTLASSSTEKIFALTIDSTFVYFSTSLGPPSLAKVPIGGGMVTSIFQGADQPLDLKINSAYIYWTGANTVMRMPVGGGQPTAILSANAPCSSLAIAGTYVYWTTSGSPAYPCSVMKGPLGGGTSTQVASTPYPCDAHFIDADGTNEFWSDTITGALNKVDSNGVVTTLYSGSMQTAMGIAVDQNYVYMAGGNDGTVKKVSYGGGAPIVLASGQSFPYAIALDANFVYFTNDSDGTVKKVHK
jgi:hypothetical protein